MRSPRLRTRWRISGSTPREMRSLKPPIPQNNDLRIAQQAVVTISLSVTTDTTAEELRGIWPAATRWNTDDPGGRSWAAPTMPTRGSSRRATMPSSTLSWPSRTSSSRKISTSPDAFRAHVFLARPLGDTPLMTCTSFGRSVWVSNSRLSKSRFPPRRPSADGMMIVTDGLFTGHLQCIQVQSDTEGLALLPQRDDGLAFPARLHAQGNLRTETDRRDVHGARRGRHTQDVCGTVARKHLTNFCIAGRTGYPYPALQASIDNKPISISVRDALTGQADRAPAPVKLTVDSFNHAEASKTRKQHQRPPDLDSASRNDGASRGHQR